MEKYEPKNQENLQISSESISLPEDPRIGTKIVKKKLKKIGCGSFTAWGINEDQARRNYQKNNWGFTTLQDLQVEEDNHQQQKAKYENKGFKNIGAIPQKDARKANNLPNKEIPDSKIKELKSRIFLKGRDLFKN